MFKKANSNYHFVLNVVLQCIVFTAHYIVSYVHSDGEWKIQQVSYLLRPTLRATTTEERDNHKPHKHEPQAIYVSCVYNFHYTNLPGTEATIPCCVRNGAEDSSIPRSFPRTSSRCKTLFTDGRSRGSIVNISPNP